MSLVNLPLFPLRSVLFPEGMLKLRIFETRYVDMIGRCMREDTGFGVVLIVEGMEAGSPVTTAETGTLARVTDFEQLSDGLLGITAQGQQRFKLITARRQPDGLNMGEIEWLADDATLRVPPEHADLADALRDLWPKLTEGREVTPPPRYDEALWVSSRLAEILPLELADRQRCLEMDDPIERLQFLRERIPGVALD